MSDRELYNTLQRNDYNPSTFSLTDYNTNRFLHPPTTQFLGNSMVLKLYGNSESPNARLVASILLEKKKEYLSSW